MDIGAEVLGLRKAKEKDEASRRKSFHRFHFLDPRKDQSERTTQLRPVYVKSLAEKVNQSGPIVRYATHDRLDQINPQTGMRLYPGLQPGIEETVCLNMAEGYDYCRICRDQEALRSIGKDLTSRAEQTKNTDDKALARSYGMWFGNIKRTPFILFVAIRRISKAEIRMVDGDKKKAGMMSVNKKGEPCSPDDENFAGFVDPVGMARIKEYFADDDGGQLYKLLTERDITKSEFENELGRECTMEEYIAGTKPKRGNPFDVKEGWAIEVHVHGKKLDKRYDYSACSPKPLSKADCLVLKKAYPDVGAVVHPPGFEKVVPFEDSGWKKEYQRLTGMAVPEADDLSIFYETYQMKLFEAEQRRILGLDQHDAVLTLEQAKGSTAPPPAQEEAKKFAAPEAEPESDDTPMEEPAFDLEGEFEGDDEVPF